MDNLRFSSIAKRYATGISFTVRSKIAYRRSPRARTPAAYFKACSRPFGNPFSLSVRCTFQPPIGWECTNSARRVRAVRRSRLSWDYAETANFMGQLRAKYRFCAVRALRAAVRPAFAVPIYAPGWQVRFLSFPMLPYSLKNFYKFSKIFEPPPPSASLS